MVDDKKVDININQTVDEAYLQQKIDEAVDQKVNERMDEFKRNFENMVGGGVPKQTRLGPLRDRHNPRDRSSGGADAYTDAAGNEYIVLDEDDLTIEGQRRADELREQLTTGQPQPRPKTPRALAKEQLKHYDNLIKQKAAFETKQGIKTSKEYLQELEKYKARVDRIDKYYSTTGMPHDASYLYELMDLSIQDGELSDAYQHLERLEQIMNEDAYGKGPVGYLDTQMKRTSPKTFLDAARTNDPDPSAETFGYGFDTTSGTDVRSPLMPGSYQRPSKDRSSRSAFTHGYKSNLNLGDTVWDRLVGSDSVSSLHGPRKHKGSQYGGILGWLETHGKAYGMFKIVSKAGMANLNPYGFMGYVLGLITRKGPMGAALAFGITGAWVAPHLAANMVQIMGRKGHPLNRDFVKLTDDHTYGLWSLQEEKRRLLGHDAYIVTQTDRYEPQSGSTTFNSLENRDNVIMSKIGLAEKALGVTYQGWT